MKAGLLPRLVRPTSLTFAALTLSAALACANAQAQVVVGGTGRAAVNVNLDALNQLQSRPVAPQTATAPAQMAPSLPGASGLGTPVRLKPPPGVQALPQTAATAPAATQAPRVTTPPVAAAPLLTPV